MSGNSSAELQLSDNDIRDLNMTIEMFGRDERQIREPYLSLILSAYLLIIIAAGRILKLGKCFKGNEP